MRTEEEIQKKINECYIEIKNLQGKMKYGNLTKLDNERLYELIGISEALRWTLNQRTLLKDFE